jgi:hypothetical protein
LRALFSLLSHIEHECLVVDSTEVTDWFMGFMSYSLNVSGQHAISSTRQANSSELKFTNGYLKGLCLVMGHSTLNQYQTQKDIYIVGRSLTIPGGLDLKHNASYAARNPVANMLKREVFSADYLSQVRL